MKSIFVRASVLMCMAAFSFAMAQVDTTKAVKLGTTWVPKDSFIVYIGAGHSNMVGRTSSGQDLTTNPRCWNYKIDQTTPAWILAKPIIHCDISTCAGNGPWVSWLKNMAGKHPGYYFGVITNPGSGYAMSDYKAGSGSKYIELRDAAKKWVGKCTFGGLLMMLGETSDDRESAANAAAFADNAVAIIKAMRTDLQAPNMPFYVNQWEANASGTYSPTRPNAQTMIKGMWSIPSKVNYAVTVPTNGIPMTDDHHFTNAGYATMTSRHIDSMHAHKWFPDVPHTTAAENNFTGHKNAVELSLDLKQLNKNSLVISFPAAIANPTVKVFDSKGALVAGRGYTLGDKLGYDFPEGQSGCFFVKVTNDGKSYVRRFFMVR